jgi:demethylmenaquinone methyltransferase/2-methoxy-6-polyprenyl-1,4-benzoquinol methylase
LKNRQVFFNKASEYWDNKFDNPKLHKFLKEFVLSFGLFEGQHILDVGTGTGILIPYLYKIVGSKGHITAIDYAHKMVEICKIKHGDFPNLSIIVAKAETLQFADNSFDAIICFGVFPHLDNKQVALTQFNRILKSEGKLIIAHALSREEVGHHHQHVPEVAKDRLPNKKEMRKILQKANFTEINITDKKGSYLCFSKKQ